MQHVPVQIMLTERKKSYYHQSSSIVINNEGFKFSQLRKEKCVEFRIGKSPQGIVKFVSNG